MLVVVHELNLTEVKQKIIIGDRPLMIHAVCPYLFRWLAPAGTCYVQLQDENGKKIADSESLTISTIGTGNYWHGFQRFLLSASLKEGQTYYLALKTSGYTYGAIAYLGWANSYELRNAGSASYSPSTGLNAPLGLRLWHYSFTEKGD
mgnify:CR=1 FL=1